MWFSGVKMMSVNVVIDLIKVEIVFDFFILE